MWWRCEKKVFLLFILCHLWVIRTNWFLQNPHLKLIQHQNISQILFTHKTAKFIKSKPKCHTTWIIYCCFHFKWLCNCFTRVSHADNLNIRLVSVHLNVHSGKVHQKLTIFYGIHTRRRKYYLLFIFFANKTMQRMERFAQLDDKLHLCHGQWVNRKWTTIWCQLFSKKEDHLIVTRQNSLQILMINHFWNNKN